ncbi:hypothetical protein [Rhodococcus sp. MEB032]|uniref:hypothetical protein n=1 Tax=Rhodococcus sp. MEB032 TaxID=3040322 RepID=UPI00254B031A|nr:hypothetical protein [Rhodococcus sp. MEB032]
MGDSHAVCGGPGSAVVMVDIVCAVHLVAAVAVAMLVPQVSFLDKSGEFEVIVLDLLENQGAVLPGSWRSARSISFAPVSHPR